MLSSAPWCECRQRGCACINDTDLMLSEGSRVCGCCLADCPGDVHDDARTAGAKAQALI